MFFFKLKIFPQQEKELCLGWEQWCQAGARMWLDAWILNCLILWYHCYFHFLHDEGLKMPLGRQRKEIASLRWPKRSSGESGILFNSCNMILNLKQPMWGLGMKLRLGSNEAPLLSWHLRFGLSTSYFKFKSNLMNFYWIRSLCLELQECGEERVKKQLINT